MAIAVDYSDARPSVAELKAAGVSGVLRYLTGGAKAITPIELAGLLFGGIEVGFVFELGVNDIAGGQAAGAAHAQAAVAALGRLGVATTSPVYYAVDEDVPNPQSAVPYFQGVASIVPPTSIGDYGQGSLALLLSSEGLSHYHWLSESTGFPGYEAALSAGIVCLVQKFDASPIPDTDLDEILMADWGQVPRPVGPAPSKGEGMLAPTPSGKGLWRCDATGAVTTYGDAQYLGGPNTSQKANGQWGGPPVLPAGETCVSIAAHPTLQGYWIESNVGNIYAYGSAKFMEPNA